MGDLHLVDTSVRISDAAYSNLVKARGMLETFHEGRLSLDDAVYISTRFTYEVTRLLMKEQGVSVAFATGVNGKIETGAFLSLGHDSLKYPQKFVMDLMDLTRLLLRKPRKEAIGK
jgi:hypothetical protein